MTRSRRLNRAEKDRTATPSSWRRVDGVEVMIEPWWRRVARRVDLCAVQGLVDGLALGQRVGEALAHADAGGGDECGDAARHVHRAAAGEVDDAAVAEEARARAPGRELARAPHHVDDGRVDEAREDDRVERIGEERGPLGDGAGDDRAAGAGEGPAEEPAGLGVGRLVRRGDRAEEAARAREAVLARRREVVAVAAGERRADGVPHDRRDAGIKNVLHQNVLRVLLVDGADLEHGEARLERRGRCLLNSGVESFLNGSTTAVCGPFSLENGRRSGPRPRSDARRGGELSKMRS